MRKRSYTPVASKEGGPELVATTPSKLLYAYSDDDDDGGQGKAEKPSMTWLQVIQYTFVPLLIRAAVFGLIGYVHPAGADSPTEASLEAMKNVRSPASFQWHTVTFLAVVFYAYAVEVERRNYHIFFAGLFVAADDLISEMMNALVLHYTNYSAIWTTPANSAYVLFVGLNIEIYFMFCMFGIVLSKLTPGDASATTNFCFLPIKCSKLTLYGFWFGTLAFVVELWLNNAGVMPWAYPLWCRAFPFLMWQGYVTGSISALKIREMPVPDARRVVMLMFAAAAVMFVVFGTWLGWV